MSEATTYRGGCRTGDDSQPVIFTARRYPTEREALKAIRRAVRYVGYDVSRNQLFVVPHRVEECTACEGTGYTLGAHEECSWCDGTGVAS